MIQRLSASACACSPQALERVRKQFPVSEPEGKGGALRESAHLNCGTARRANTQIVQTHRLIDHLEVRQHELPGDMKSLEKTLKVHDPVRKAAVGSWFLGVGLAVASLPTFFVSTAVAARMLVGGIGMIAATYPVHILNDRMAGGDPLDRQEALYSEQDSLPQRLQQAREDLPALQAIRAEAMTAARTAMTSWRKELPVPSAATPTKTAGSIEVEAHAVKIGSLYIPRNTLPGSI